MNNLEIKNQNGRSMIEMLGVLAIIGVLSVGGIAGYSKAMMKYRINKTIEQITLVAGNVRTFFASQGNYDGLDSVTNDGRKIIQKAKLVPDEMWNENKTKLINVFGNVIEIRYGASSADGKRESDKKIFNIKYSGIPEEACIDILTQDWSDLRIKMIGASGSNNGDNTGGVPISINDATELCDGGVERLEFVFDAKETWMMY